MDDDDRVVRPGFHARVYEVVKRVPAGRVTTYGDVAAILGSPRVARHVGWALAALHDDEVPWHRVLNAKGTISVPPGGLRPSSEGHRGDTARCVLQQSLLEREGIVFDERGRIDLRAYRWRPE
jgi:methylated-DNA-protein-cysteine methyltransferase-like protein